MLRDPALIPLSHQHHNGLALCVLTERSLRADTSARNLERLARKIIDRFEIELVNHFEIEEQVLFPALAGLPLTAALIDEHRRLEALVERLRAEAPAQALIEEFTTLLRSHIRSEENQLFQEAQQSLPAEVLAALGRDIDARAVRVCVEP